MAIIRYDGRKGVSYKVRIRGSDGYWIGKTFPTRKEAEAYEAQMLFTKRRGGVVTNARNTYTVSEFFDEWSAGRIGTGVSKGWLHTQAQMFGHHIEPVIGRAKIGNVTPAFVGRVLSEAADKGLGQQTRVHLYNLMHKLFDDAVVVHQILDRNPVIRPLKPKVPTKEAAYLQVQQVVTLLRYVQGKEYEAAIWLNVVAGLRVGEIQALRWDWVDLDRGLVHVRGTYARKEDEFRDYPKGKRWRTVTLSPELVELLRREKAVFAGEYVVRSPSLAFLSYHSYYKRLKDYCKEAGVPSVATHGLRHSASEVWRAFGGSRDDLRVLYGHSSGSVTDRYVHDHGERLGRVSNVIRLVSAGSSEDVCSQNVPKLGTSESGS